MVVLDTSVIIDHLRRKIKGTILDLLVEKYGWSELAISTVSVQELFVGLSSKNQKEEILNLISLMKILPYTFKVAEKAGEILRDSKTGMNFVDAAIAATCVLNDCKLATLNTGDFLKIKGLDLMATDVGIAD